MHHPTDRIIHTTAFGTPVVEHWLEQEIAQWVHPMKDRSNDPLHHERTLLPQSYVIEYVIHVHNLHTLEMRGLLYHYVVISATLLLVRERDIALW